MKRIASMFAFGAVAALAGAPALAQEVVTPSSVMEAGFDDVLAPQALSGPVGATISAGAGGVVSTSEEGAGLVKTPDWKDEPSDD